jgi:hypothetical protein
MASPAFRAQTHELGSGEQSFTATEPAGSAEGDVILAAVLLEAGTNLNTPSGWTLLAGPVDPGPYLGWLFAIRRGASAPALGWTWTTNSYFEFHLGAWSGCVSSGEFIDAQADGGTATTNAPNGPAVTTQTTDTTVISFAWTWAGWGASSTPPTGYTERDAFDGFDVGFADKAIGSPTTEDPGAWGGTNGSDAVWTYTIALASQAAAAAANDNTMSAAKNLLRRTANYRR